MISIGSIFKLSSIVSPCKGILSSCRQSIHLYNPPCSAARTLEERLGIPLRPKKPLTPYFRFMKQIRPTVLAENPKANIVDVVKIIASKWEKVDEATKKRLQAEFKKEQEAYVAERAKYDSKITDEQRTEIKQLKQEIVEAREKRANKKRIRELGRPKRPASAFLRFISQERTKTPQGKGQTYKEWHMKVTEKWTRLADAEKNVFIQEARKELEKYKEEISKWEEKMVRLGHIDVVRNESLIDPPEPKPRRKPKKTE